VGKASVLTPENQTGRT